MEQMESNTPTQSPSFQDLTPKQKAFVRAYIEGITKGNAAASARKAGYSPKASNAAGARLYKSLKHVILTEQGRHVDVKREVWHKDRETTIGKITTDLESLEAKHANKPKYWDMLLKLRGWYTESSAGTPLITLAVQGGLHLYAQRLAKEFVADKEFVEGDVSGDVLETKINEEVEVEDGSGRLEEGEAGWAGKA